MSLGMPWSVPDLTGRGGCLEAGNAGSGRRREDYGQKHALLDAHQGHDRRVAAATVNSRQWARMVRSSL